MQIIFSMEKFPHSAVGFRSKDQADSRARIFSWSVEGEPQVMFKLVGTFRTALSRQIMEAVVRIRGRGTSVLNSKGEYD